MEAIKPMLSEVRASKFTYYNLDKKTVDDFKKLYSYLKNMRIKMFLIYQ